MYGHFFTIFTWKLWYSLIIMRCKPSFTQTSQHWFIYTNNAKCEQNYFFSWHFIHTNLYGHMITYIYSDKSLVKLSPFISPHNPRRDHGQTQAPPRHRVCRQTDAAAPCGHMLIWYFITYNTETTYLIINMRLQNKFSDKIFQV